MQKNNGFTLIEILIALFVFAIVSMIMVAGLHSVTTTQGSLEKRAERLSELQIAFTTISRDFEQVINRPITGANGLENAFLGYPQSVIFSHGGLANPLGQLNRSTLQRTEYLLENGSLIRVTWPVLDHSMKVKADQRTLLTQVDNLQFEYLDSKNKFLEKWPSPNQPQALLPKAVRITMTLKNSGKISQLYIIPAQIPEPNTPNPEKKSGPDVDITT